MIPRGLTPEGWRQQRREACGGQPNSTPELLTTVEYVPNEDYYNPPQYTRREYLNMVITPRPRVPVTSTTTYQFYDPYEENTNHFDYRDMYPDRSEEILQRWFPRYG
ncbi:hypothetical protein TWF730_007871 [Orbilia blumenaviensis]|uniref:Uncharacterized protein n=1 Tax=Orbilia blumenaviensis TaxID=1796055 RepID=A0AAV9V994_9PEZI